MDRQCYLLYMNYEYLLPICYKCNVCASWHDSFLRQSYRFVETLDWFQRKFLLTLFQQSITKPNKLIVLKQRSQTVINCTTQNVIRKCKQSSPQFISYDIIMFAD